MELNTIVSEVGTLVDIRDVSVNKELSRAGARLPPRASSGASATCAKCAAVTPAHGTAALYGKSV